MMLPPSSSVWYEIANGLSAVQLSIVWSMVDEMNGDDLVRSNDPRSTATPARHQKIIVCKRHQQGCVMRCLVGKVHD